MTDGVTPLCVYCGEPVELARYMVSLNAHQPLMDWMDEAVPDVQFRATPKCEACRADPERAIEMMSRVSTEELRARMRGPS